MPLTRTKFSLLAVLALLLALVAGGVTVAPAPASATPAPGHPFSDPLWVPLHSVFRAGCIGSSIANNGPRSGVNHCANDHKGYFAMNLSVPWKIADGRINPQPHPPVYAAGSGTVVKVTTGSAPCERSGRVGSGNQVWISHGAGIVSVYLHLLSVYVHAGAVVTPRTAIGTAGATGAECDASGHPQTAYLDFQVRKWGGSSALTNPIPSLIGCVGTSTQAVRWPAALTRNRYELPRGMTLPSPLPRTWIQVPYGAGIQTDASQWRCVRANGAGTPLPATGLRRSGSTITWTPVAGANLYTVQLEIPRGSSWGVPCSPFAQAGCSYGYYLFTATSRPHFSTTRTGRWRVRVYAHNAVGWSLPTAWVVH